MYQKNEKDKLKIELKDNIFYFDGECEKLPEKVVKWFAKPNDFWDKKGKSIKYGPWKIGEPHSLFDDSVNYFLEHLDKSGNIRTLR